MHLNFCNRVRTVSKDFIFDNYDHWGFKLYFTVLLIFKANLSISAPIPVEISWREAPGKDQTYLIEISDDSKFGTSVFKSEVRGHKLKWESPKEAVYHWRVNPMSRISKDGAEVSSFASGSFAAIEPVSAPSAVGENSSDSPAKTVELKWSEVDGATAYYLNIQANGIFKSRLVSLKPSSSIMRTSDPQAIQVQIRAVNSNSRIAKDAISHFDPGFVIVKEQPVTQSQQPREMIVGDQPIPAPEPPKIELVPLPSAPGPIQFDPSGKTVHYIEDDSIPELRLSEVVLGIYGGTENTFASQKQISRHSKQSVSGGFLTLRTVPLQPLHLFAEATGHGRQAKWKSELGVESSGQPISSYIGQVGLGVDLFFRNPNRRHTLVLEVRGAMLQTPMIPFESPFQGENLDQIQSQLIGGGAWYRWTVRRWGIGLNAAKLVQSTERSKTNDTVIDQWGGYLAVDPTKYMTLLIGGQSRVLYIARCHKVESDCQNNGTSVTRSSLVNGYLGLGYVFY
ncbi:MAG: hypothetical protein NT027_09690 [Proteobacteria bacterium]|nr:hypothetical protein [Pseudomonadota bacterium]